MKTKNEVDLLLLSNDEMSGILGGSELSEACARVLGGIFGAFAGMLSSYANRMAELDAHGGHALMEP